MTGTGALILVSALVNLAAFVCFPETGRFGWTFLYISVLLWAAFAFFLGAHPPLTAAGSAARLLTFALGCALAVLSFLPQRDAVSPLRKLSDGRYPDRRAVFLGLLRLGIDWPGLLPPQKPEVLP